MTLASIVEREAVWPDEHAMIASVYRNRLAIGMRLEADPTVSIWPARFCAAAGGPISLAPTTHKSIRPTTPICAGGLPPSPIASPGLSAIQAVITPADSPYLYFRAACDNSHYHNFAITFEEHLQNGC